jgi:hypothetical protein
MALRSRGAVPEARNSAGRAGRRALLMSLNMIIEAPTAANRGTRRPRETRVEHGPRRPWASQAGYAIARISRNTAPISAGVFRILGVSRAYEGQ